MDQSRALDLGGQGTEGRAQSRERKLQQYGVIWVTGFSGAGKTSVGRLVERRLRAQGVNTLLLDGDDLRSIFGERWGYDRASRVELARVYFRLCSHLASQGLTVVIAAVAMYKETYEWVRINIPRAVQVYLRVPEEERRRRDQATKQLYDKIGDLRQLYDEPKDPDLLLDNYGASTPDEMAEKIVEYFWCHQGRGEADHGRTTHWSAYYKNTKGTLEPSAFGREVVNMLSTPSRILEIGCGNGRDASFFAQHDHSVVALDVSPAAIELCRDIHRNLPIHFIDQPVAALESQSFGNFDVVYSRFCLHAMTEFEEIEMLETSARLLLPGGKLFIECRSINDPLARKGEVISPTERIYGHYRRFIILEELVERVSAAGMSVISTLESKDLAVFGNENPVVIRLSARKDVT